MIIIVRVSGGLGNQLFQYALGKNLSIMNNARLKFDTSGYYKDASRNYLLDKFKIPESTQISTINDTRAIGIPQIFNNQILNKATKKIFRATEYFKPIRERKFIIEPYFHFCNDIINIKNSCYISGVWQSEKYFKNNEHIIKKELLLNSQISNNAEYWIKKISQCNSISIHIRRGDYLNNKKHPVCDLKYYYEAIDLISQKIIDLKIFVFSDDMEWVKKNLKTKHTTYYVSNKENQDYEELIIMSKCRHNIIADSSFSWWGAWLNENTNKIIITPKGWLCNEKINTEDLIPKSWIKI